MATSTGYTPTTGRLRSKQFRLTTFNSRHRTNHCFNPLELLFPLLKHAVIQLVHAWHHLDQATERTHAFDQSHLLQEIRKVKRCFLQLFLHLLDISKLHLFLSFLNKGEHIAHTKDAAGHALWMERLQGLNFFTSADELDRLTTHLANRKRRPTTRITIKLGKHRSSDANLVVKRPS